METPAVPTDAPSVNSNYVDQERGSQIGSQTNVWENVKTTVEQIIEDEQFIKVVSAILLYIPIVAYISTSIGWYHTLSGPTITIITIFIAALGLGTYHVVSYAEPGIIPRLHDTYEAFDAIRMRRKYTHVPSCIEVTIAGKFLRIKYCHTCNIYRPPRSVHCSVCDVCVHKFDHHCKWLGNCIGGKNHKAFYGFLFFTFIEGLLIFSLAIARITIMSVNRIGRNYIILSALLLAYVVLSGWFVAGLLIYHTYLICVNKTTNEQLKSLYADYNPWDRGILINLKDALLVHAKMKSLCDAKTVAMPIYDPGRSFPVNYKATYASIQQFESNKDLGFDHVTNQDWDKTENTPEDIEGMETANGEQNGNVENITSQASY
ncbi:DHHC zinc finger domain containing protein [Babesia bovis T2Bo]|uniref:Palmitoyltransferase n=1 Tax=Babesia bovis TaxID=5865 RepID=A7ATI7_BABBO|nr:DHHC zinc finger domain containing protein [Babesia bovis T2Bo]EDO06248.1 DHHC zinc finger domain containing protein [Babesia bovis T2Bo]|eukprot:XP_001609816.1 DHHC zinc finger domain containing protein [Babesia bovis T2Bo]